MAGAAGQQQLLDLAGMPKSDILQRYPVPHLAMMQMQKYGHRFSGLPYVRLANGILVPPDHSGNDHSSNVTRGGVCSADGVFDPLANHYSSIWPWVESSGQWYGEMQIGHGRVLYAGVAREHFGHFLTESLGRIWLNFIGGPDVRPESICFLRSPAGPPSREGMELLSLFRDMPPVTVLDRPTRFSLRVDELEDPLGVVEDTSQKGGWGTGFSDVILKTPTELPYIVGLCEQAFLAQMGEQDAG